MNIAFDIGGTNMRVAAVNGNELGAITKVPTPQDPVEGIAAFASIARTLSGGTIERAVGGVPSSVAADGQMHDAPNLPRWEGMKVAEEIARVTGAEVRVFNDTAVVGYGELKRGAGRGFARIAYLTVSTGVGGALINDTNLAQSDILGFRFPELKRDLQSQISGTAVRKKFGIEPKDLESLEERNALASILAIGLSEIAKIWRPDVFVLGGSMIVGQNPIPLERVREEFTMVPVNMAELGDNGGLIGGMILATET